MRQIAGDDDRVGRAVRRTRNPIRPNPTILKRRVSSRLIGAERTAARQDQGNPIETGQAVIRSRARQDSISRIGEKGRRSDVGTD